MVDNKDLVSIVVPVYKTEKYLINCIDSIRNQSYNNIQIILVDDGSPDNCPKICDTYAEKDCRIVVVHQKNSGVSSARNNGIKHATGKYIMFVDSDDELELNAVEILVSDIVEYNADIVSASKKSVNEEAVVLSSQNEDGKKHLYCGDEMMKKALQYENTTRALHAKLFSREIISDIRFVEGRHINEDGYFMFECYGKKPEVLQHNVSVYKYFQRESSSTHGEFSEKYFDMLYFCDLKMSFIQKKMPYFEEYAKDMIARTHLLFLQVLCRSGNKKYKEEEKKSIKTVRKFYKYYKPINSHHKKMAWLVVHGLFPFYKMALRMKYYR